MRTQLFSLRNASLAAISSLALWSSVLIAQPAQATAMPIAHTYQEGRVINGDKTITGSEFTLQSGDRLRGNLTVLGGAVTVEEGSLVDGTLTILGGSADVAGRISGDVNVLGGELNLDSGSRVDGELSSVGGDINRDESAQVGSVRDTDFDKNMRHFSPWQHMPGGRWFDTWDNGSDHFGGLIAITLFAIVVAHFFPKRLTQGMETARSFPLHSLVIGGLSFAAAIAASVFMSITVLMIPAAIVLSLAAGLLGLAGWSIVARIVGARLMQGFGKIDWTLTGQVAAGALLLAILGMLPIVGDFIGYGAMLTGLGALILTRLGTQIYPKQNTALTTMPPNTPMSV